jgi:hypothetical protein
MSTVQGSWRGPNIIKDGLVLYLDSGSPNSFFNKNGTTFKDISGNNYSGSLTNYGSQTRYDQNDSQSMLFDGTDDFVEFGDILDLGTNSMTVNQWIKLNTVSSQIFLSKALAGGQNYRFANGINFVSPTNRLYAFMQGNSGGDIVPYGSTVLSANTWFMATFVFERSSSIKIYYNGVLETLTGNATISQWNGLNFQSINPFRVGTYTSSNNIGIVGPTNGKIAITQVYHRVLSPTEIQQNFNATRARFGI